MSIISRICEKYENDYSVMSEGWMEPVYLEFGDDITSDIQRRLEQELDRVDVALYSDKCFLNLKLDRDMEGVYRLSCSDGLLYRFVNRAPGCNFLDYDFVRAIAWTIYAIASNNEKQLLGSADGELKRGAYVCCQSFSAKQQAVASRIMRSVIAQTVNEIPENKVVSTVEQMLVYADRFTQSIPLFSYRPILESAYDDYRGRNVEKDLGEIAEELFGKDPFETEITLYREFIRGSESYDVQVVKARRELTRIIYELPIMAVQGFLVKLRETIVSLNKMPLSYAEELMTKMVHFSLTKDTLKSTFAEVDNFYSECTRHIIQQDFLNRVLEETRLSLHNEHLTAKNICRQMRHELPRFCFVEQETFREDTNTKLLTWKQLMNLQESDLSIAADIQWSAETMIKLQRRFMEEQEPTCWLCMPSLQEQSEQMQLTDQFSTKAVPLMDRRYVFALWVREYLM